MMKKAISVLILAGATFVAPVSAYDFNYNYIEGSLGKVGVGSTDTTDENIVSAVGSYDVKPQVNLIGGYSTAKHLNVAHFGVGYHKSLNYSTDVLGKVRVLNNNTHGTGYGLGLGVRHDFTNGFEAEASLDFTDISVSDTSMSFVSRYNFNREMSVGLGFDTASSGIFNLRMNF